MQTLRSRLAASVLMGVGCLAAGTQCLADTQATTTKSMVNPAEYPRLTDKQAGHLRHIVKLAGQLPGDWSGMGSDWWGIGERMWQFELGYMAMALALAQHQYTPAYREPYQASMDALIQKMTLPDVWERWINISRGSVVGGTEEVQAGGIATGSWDPIAAKNVMLKGYLLQSAAMYEMLYRDGKYDRPGAFEFKHVGESWGNGRITFSYSLPDVARIMHQEYVDSDYLGIQCEPNRVFLPCQQPVFLGLISFDQTHRTSYAVDAMQKWKARWLKEGLIDEQNKTASGMIFVEQNQRGNREAVSAWTGSWMNAWDPSFTAALYSVQKPRAIDLMLSGGYARPAAASLARGDGTGTGALGFGLFAFWAAEMGDADTTRKMLDYADRNFGPVWDNGAYRYPRSDDFAPDANGNSRGVDLWTANALIPLARLDTGGGIRKLYTHPWGKEQLAAPYVTDVDDLTTNVTQAFYDTAKQALIVTIEPGPLAASNVTFVVRQLAAGKSYTVTRDGVVLGTVRADGSSSAPGVERRSDDTVLVTTDLKGPRTFVLVARS